MTFPLEMFLPPGTYYIPFLRSLAFQIYFQFKIQFLTICDWNVSSWFGREELTIAFLRSQRIYQKSTPNKLSKNIFYICVWKLIAVAPIIERTLKQQKYTATLHKKLTLHSRSLDCNQIHYSQTNLLHHDCCKVLFASCLDSPIQLHCVCFMYQQSHF